MTEAGATAGLLVRVELPEEDGHAPPLHEGPHEIFRVDPPGTEDGVVHLRCLDGCPVGTFYGTETMSAWRGRLRLDAHSPSARERRLLEEARRDLSGRAA